MGAGVRHPAFNRIHDGVQIGPLRAAPVRPYIRSMNTTTPIPIQRSRRVERVVRGQPTSDGAGVKLTRVLTNNLQQRLDPFLMLDAFGSDAAGDYIAGFPDHPHRGFETVTIMKAGRMRHRDSVGNVGLLEPGSVQWMTAGRGIIHSEMPEQQEGRMAGNPWCRRARQSLRDAGVVHHYLEYGSYLSLWRKRNALKMWTGWPTFPMVFVKGRLIGGAQDLTRLLASGELQRLLGEPDA